MSRFVPDPTKRRDVYQEITDRICAKLEAGTAPWKQPWKSSTPRTAAGVLGTLPRNATTGHVYSGVNRLLLWGEHDDDPRYLTFKQAHDLGGNVRKGEHGYQIAYAKRTFFTRTDDDGNETTRAIPMLKLYTVFHVGQCDGLAFPAVKPQPVAPEMERIDSVEAIIAGYPNGPTVRHEAQNRAYYSPAADTVTLPMTTSFHAPAGYYETILHELTHSTGHTSRLARFGANGEHASFGSQIYSREELVAEIGAAFLGSLAGIEPPMDNHAAYCASWVKALKGDTHAIAYAAGRAQAAADHILGITAEGDKGEDD